MQDHGVTPHVTRRESVAPLMDARRGSRLCGAPEKKQAGGRNLRLGQDRRPPMQHKIYRTGQGGGTNRLHLGCLQADADGYDLWLAIEHRIGRNPPAAEPRAPRTPKRGLKKLLKSGFRPGNGFAGSSSSSSVVGSQRHQGKFQRPANQAIPSFTISLRKAEDQARRSKPVIAVA
jgi:hypothetical protein